MADGVYEQSAVIQVPANLADREAPYYLILRVDDSRWQLDTDESNNEFIKPISLTSGVEFTNLRQGVFLGGGERIELSWHDFVSHGPATISIGIDSDMNIANGVQSWLVSSLAASPDGDKDRAMVEIPSLPVGEYYLTAKIEDSLRTHYSQPTQVKIVDEAYRDLSLQTEPVGGGSFEVHNVEWGRIGDEVVFRVLTNYDPNSSGGGDLYINVGGDYLEGNGRLAGIALHSRTTASGLPVVAGDMYLGASFLQGTSRRQHPTYIKSYTNHVAGKSSLSVRNFRERILALS